MREKHDGMMDEGSTLILFIYLAMHAACKILVLQPGIKPRPTAVEVWSLNHWTARELLFFFFIYFKIHFSFSFFLLHCTVCRILVPQPRVEPRPSTVKTQSPNH